LKLSRGPVSLGGLGQRSPGQCQRQGSFDGSADRFRGTGRGQRVQPDRGPGRDKSRVEIACEPDALLGSRDRRVQIARVLALASLLGAASSSCSYAAVALARSLFRKGADFTAAMTFELASTNLVIELGIILALLMGWQFTLAEFVGGGLIIFIVAGSRNAAVVEGSISLNYTSVLNVAFLVLAAVLVTRSLQLGGRHMLAMMDSSDEEVSKSHGM
jgi:hypothetical protein